MLKTLGSLCALVLALNACGTAKTETASETKAQVTAQQANQAFSIVKNLDYLPFLYIEDGCYARSLYMSMELATVGIPSSAFYVYGDLRPTNKVSWVYHVAPLIQIGSNEPLVLDPAFQKNPLTMSQWIKKDMPVNGYTWVLKAGSAYFDPSGRTRQFNNNRMVQNLREMPAFLSSDITSACTVMFNYIPNHARSTSEANAMRTKLLSRTSQMMKTLLNQGKLQYTGVSSDSNSYCARAAGY